MSPFRAIVCRFLQLPMHERWAILVQLGVAEGLTRP